MDDVPQDLAEQIAVVAGKHLLKLTCLINELCEVREQDMSKTNIDCNKIRTTEAENSGSDWILCSMSQSCFSFVIGSIALSFSYLISCLMATSNFIERFSNCRFTSRISLYTEMKQYTLKITHFANLTRHT